MANKGLEMVEIKQIIRLHTEGKSYRDIKHFGIIKESSYQVYTPFKSTGLSYESLNEKSDKELIELMAEPGEAK